VERVFASYTDFSSDAENFARSRNIELLRNDDIKEKLYTALSGRSAEKGDRVYIETALPVNVDYNNATALELNNRNKISVASARLVFHPYFRFSYKMKRVWFDKHSQKNRTFEDSGIVIIDLLDSEVVTQSENPNRYNEVEKNKPLNSISIPIDQNYRVIKLEPKYNKKALKTSAFSYIIEKNMRQGFAPKREDITLDIGTPVFLPKWEINFDACGKIYSREILACSGNVIIDTIANCPNHDSFLSSLTSPKKVIAVCEECGSAFCNSHGTQCIVCKKWLCNNHIIHCSICQAPFCKDHINQSCTLCKEYVCENCLVSCPKCNRVYGKNHTKQCNYCNKQVCSECTTTVGTILKKHYCKDQCDLIVKAEKEKTGLMDKIKGKFV
jgi:hypothetical protein